MATSCLERYDDGTKLGKEFAEARDSSARFFMQTSQAEDISRGCDKDNALPETVTVTVNYRVAPDDSLDIAKASVFNLLEPIAYKPGFSIPIPSHQTTDSNQVDVRTGLIGLQFRRMTHHQLSERSLTLTHCFNRPPERSLTHSAPIQQVLDETESQSGKRVISEGYNMQRVAKNIYRLSPMREGTVFGVQTIGEHVNEWRI